MTDFNVGDLPVEINTEDADEYMRRLAAYVRMFSEKNKRKEEKKDNA